MKSVTLSLASILTTVLLLSQPVLAATDGGGALQGDNPADAIVPDGAGLPLDGFDCNTCRSHADRVARGANTIPRAGGSKTGTGDVNDTKGNKGFR